MAQHHPVHVGMSEERWCASSLGRDTAQCAWRRRHGFDVPLPAPGGFGVPTPPPTFSPPRSLYNFDGTSPYDEWWELSEPQEDVALLKRQRWWWAGAGAALGFALGAIIYAQV